MDLGLKGCRALITGASQGIGKAIAFELAAEGVDVAMCARGETDLQVTAAALREQTGVKVFAQVADVTNPEAIRAFVDAAAAALGGLDILVNNAGSALPGTLRRLTKLIGGPTSM